MKIIGLSGHTTNAINWEWTPPQPTRMHHHRLKSQLRWWCCVLNPWQKMTHQWPQVYCCHTELSAYSQCRISSHTQVLTPWEAFMLYVLVTFYTSSKRCVLYAGVMVSCPYRVSLWSWLCFVQMLLNVMLNSGRFFIADDWGFFVTSCCVLRTGCTAHTGKLHPFLSVMSFDYCSSREIIVGCHNG